ncbi:Serine protease family s10, partial [Globisporangium polare]
RHPRHTRLGPRGQPPRTRPRQRELQALRRPPAAPGQGGALLLVHRGAGERGRRAHRALAQRRPRLLVTRRLLHGERAVRGQRGPVGEAQPPLVEPQGERRVARVARGRGLQRSAAGRVVLQRRRGCGQGARVPAALLREIRGAQGPQVLHHGRELRGHVHPVLGEPAGGESYRRRGLCWFRDRERVHG